MLFCVLFPLEWLVGLVIWELATCWKVRISDKSRYPDLSWLLSWLIRIYGPVQHKFELWISSVDKLVRYPWGYPSGYLALVSDILSRKWIPRISWMSDCSSSSWGDAAVGMSDSTPPQRLLPAANTSDAACLPLPRSGRMRYQLASSLSHELAKVVQTPDSDKFYCYHILKPLLIQEISITPIERQ